MLNTLLPGTFSFNRIDYPTKNFYCTYIVIESTALTLAPMYIDVYDVNNGQGTLKYRFNVLPSVIPAGSKEQTLTIDLSSCPREFSGSAIGFYNNRTIANFEYVVFNLFGFDEEK